MEKGEIKSLLEERDESLRVKGAQSLRFTDKAETIELYKTALSDSSIRVRKSAEESFILTLRKEDADVLFKWLSDDVNANLRTSAFEILLSQRDRFLSHIIRKSHSRKSEIRKFCADLLTGMKDETATRALKKLLHDEDINVRTAAVEALAQAGVKDAVKDILANLKKARDVYEQFTCLDALRIMGEKDLRVDVDKWMYKYEKNGVLRKVLIRIYGVSGSKAGARRLIKMFYEYPLEILEVVEGIVTLNRKSPELFAWIKNQLSLRKNHVKVIREKLERLTRHQVMNLVEFGIISGQSYKLKDALLLKAYDFEDAQLISEFVKQGGVKMWRWIEKRYHLLTPPVIQGAILALGKMEGGGIKKILNGLLEDALKDPGTPDYVLNAVIWAGARFPEVERAGELAKIFPSSSDETKLSMYRYFQSLGEKAGTKAEKYYVSLKRACAKGAEELLIWFARGSGGKIAEEAFRTFQKHPISQVRLKAVEVLLPVVKRLPEVVTFYLSDEDENVRMAAVRALSTWNASSALPYLTYALRDHSELVRVTAVDTIKSLKDLKDKHILLRIAVSDPSPYVAMSAIEAIWLSAPSGEEACLSIIEGLYHPVEDVVYETAKRLLNCKELPHVKKALTEVAEKDERVKSLVENIR